MTKIPNFENSRWRTAPILKIVLSLYLSRNHPISTKFVMQMQIMITKIFQIQNGGRRHIENRLLSISRRMIVRLSRIFV